MKPVLILKFPYSSQTHLGGGELHTINLFGAIAQRHGRFAFVGSCSLLLHEFRKRGWSALRWWAGKEPVAAWSAALFPITWPFVFVGFFLLLAFYRIKGFRTVYCLSFTEKIVATPIARLFGMRVLWVEHVASTRRWLRLNPYRPFYVLWSKLATVVGISNDVTNSLRALGVPATSLKVVYSGIDLAPYAGQHRTIAHWTRTFVIGAIARLEPEKGMVYLLRAFQTLLLSIPHARLIIAGDGSERQQLEWLARRLTIDRAVQFVGFQQPTKIPSWFESFDCFVLPSVERESFGIVLLEALAALCPVVASNLGGIPEIIHDHENGLLVPPGNIDKLVLALLEIYQHPDLAVERARRGRELVEQKFTTSTMVSSYIQLFAQ